MISPSRSRYLWCCLAVFVALLLCCSVVSAASLSRLQVVTTSPVFVLVTTVPMPEPTHLTVACQAPFECLYRSEAASRWGENGFMQGTDLPCAYVTSNVAGPLEKFCFRQKPIEIAPLVTAQSTLAPIIIVTPVTTAPQSMPVLPQAPAPTQQTVPPSIPAQILTGIQYYTQPLVVYFTPTVSSTPTISINAVKMPPTPQSIGGVVRVPLNVSYVNNITTFSIQANYWGAARVWLLDVEKGPLLQDSNSQLFWNTDKASTYSTKKEAISIITNSPNGISGSGTLCYLKLWYHWDPTQEKIDGSMLSAITQGDIKILSIDALQKDSTHMPMAIQNGKWFLSAEPAPGIDCNRDGIQGDAADAMAVKQMADGLVKPDLHCDSDSNGKIDSADTKLYASLLANPAQASKIGLI
jgi:hypothetical protein